MIALDSIEIVDKDLINVSWFENGNHWETWDSNDLFNHIIDLNDEIERLNNIIKEIERMFNHETLNKYFYGMSYEFEINDFKDDVFKIIKGGVSNEQNRI